jgi:hypothetical protein
MEEYHKHTQTHTLSDKQLSCLYFVIHKTVEFVKISMFRKCLDVIISNCCATKYNGTFELARNVGVEKNTQVLCCQCFGKLFCRIARITLSALPCG